MAEFALANKRGSLGTTANTAIFTAFTNSTGACRVRARMSLPDEATTNRIVRCAVGISAANSRIQGATLLPGDSFIVEVVLKASGDTLQAWQTVGTDVEYAIDGVDGLATS